MILLINSHFFVNRIMMKKKKKIEELKNEADDILKELRKGLDIGENIERKMNAL